MILNDEKFGGLSLVNYVDLSEVDSKSVLDMRNHQEVRKWMYNDKIIAFSEHDCFIDGLKNSKNRLFFLVIKNREWIGSINFININKGKSFSEFGLYSNPFVRLAGVGRVLEEVSIYYATYVLNLSLLKLEVYAENKKVINLHKKYDFSVKQIFKKNGKRVYSMEKTLKMVSDQ